MDTSRVSAQDFFDSIKVDADISRARSLPTWTFSDQSFLDLELDMIFRKTWLPIPHKAKEEEETDGRSLLDEVRVRGAYAPFTMLGEPLFLWRDFKKSALHCYLNACTHAWYELVSGRGKGSVISCGQHGRRFHCEGYCTAHKGFSKEAMTEEFDLREFWVDEWKHLSFLSFTNPAVSLKDIFSELSDSVAKIPLSSLKRRFHNKEIRVVRGNWKQYVINYLDKYHLGFIHPPPNGLADLIDYSSYTTEPYAHSCLQWAYAKDPELGFNPAMLPKYFSAPGEPDKRVFALWWFVFPNMVFMFFPWGLATYCYMPIPGDPSKTMFYWYQYSFDDEKYEKRNKLWLHSQINEEDVDAMSRIVRGVNSRFSPRGQFSAEEEPGPYWFHRLLYTTVVGG